MGCIQVTDEWLYKYMPVVDEALIRELENSTDYEYQFSGRFERKMKAVMWKEKHLWSKGMYKLLEHTAVWFCGIIISMSLLSVSVEGNWIKFFETARILWEDSVKYTYIVDEEPEILRELEPGFIPEGYKETKRTLTDIHFLLFFENYMNEMITWDQWLISDSESIIMDTEFDSEVTKEVNGKYVTVFCYSDGYKFAYCEYENYVYILAADNLSLDEIYKMFEF